MPKLLASNSELQSFAKRMRKCPTPSELAFSIRLDAAGIRYKFQKIMGFNIVDFYLPHRRTVIEIDGGYHAESKQRWRDCTRDGDWSAEGITTFRIQNEDVHSWDLSKIREPEEGNRKIIRATQAISKKRRIAAKAQGVLSTTKERRRARVMFGLPIGAPVSIAHILAVRNAKREKHRRKMASIS